MKTLFLGGGSGGHLVPGVAVAQVLATQGHDVLFAIAGRSIERQVLDDQGLNYHPLFGGEGGRPSLRAVQIWWRAIRRWARLVKSFEPDAIVVLGGWVAAPAVVRGFFGRPSILLEQDACPGRVSTLLKGRVTHVCLAMGVPGMPRGRFGTHVTGNPLLPYHEMDRVDAAGAFGLDPHRKTLLLMGGSQGAADLNALLPSVIAVLKAAQEPWQVLHITGKQNVVDLRENGVPVVQRPYVSDMTPAYSLATAAVCRSGGVTVSELARTGTPAVLVPYPHHANHHQEANGQCLVDVGAAVMVSRDDPQGKKTVPNLLADLLGRRERMSEAAQTQGRPHAARDVAEVVQQAMQAAG